MPAKYRLMVLLASWCAMRFGELAELRRGDIDVKNGVVRDSPRRHAGRRRGHRVDAEVSRGNRDVAIPPHLMPLVKDHLRTNITGGKQRSTLPGRGRRQPPGDVDAVQVVLQSSKRSPDARPPLGRPPPHGRGPSCLHGRDVGRADGPTRTLHTRRCPALSARGRGP